VASTNLKTVQLFSIAVMYIGTYTTKEFLEWFEKHYIPETRLYCILVGIDPKHKTVLLLHNHCLQEYIPACQT
jgi:hypothetical protein